MRQITFPFDLQVHRSRQHVRLRGQLGSRSSWSDEQASIGKTKVVEEAGTGEILARAVQSASDVIRETLATEILYVSGKHDGSSCGEKGCKSSHT